jgi:hypothetical protein
LQIRGFEYPGLLLSQDISLEAACFKASNQPANTAAVKMFEINVTY